MERSEREFILLRGKISVTLLAHTRDVITNFVLLYEVRLLRSPP